jgi:hypothetical protein
MPRKTRSAKGQMIDFDLLKIKQQIASAPPTIDVKKREDFIDRKLRRRVKRIKKVETPPVEEVTVEEETTDNKDNKTEE